MNKHCHSCGGPLADPALRGPVDNFCRYCVDRQGKLHPQDQVRKGVAQWLKSWQPGITDEEALARAGHYMKAMPSWAER